VAGFFSTSEATKLNAKSEALVLKASVHIFREILKKTGIRF
jgi:hypothetical protein